MESNMLNDMYLRFKKSFLSDTLECKFLFIDQYLRLLDDLRGKDVNIFINQDPSLMEENSNVNEMDENILDFLKDLAKKAKKLLFTNTSSSEAHTYLGLIYEMGAFGIKKSYGKAFIFYWFAFRQSNPLATLKLGEFYERGLKGSKHMGKAIKYYRYAAKHGKIDAMHTYALLLLYGSDGIKRDPKTGYVYLKQAILIADENYPYPFLDLARLFDGTHVIEELDELLDLEFALSLYKKGAFLGDPNCECKLGNIFNFGEMDQAKDLEQAIFWYARAAEKGNIEAMHCLATYKYSGIERILEQNFEEAYKLALSAAIKGHKYSALMVAEFIEGGIGVKRDLMHALWWYNIALHLGCDRAEAKVKQLSADLMANSEFVNNSKKCCIL